MDGVLGLSHTDWLIFLGFVAMGYWIDRLRKEVDYLRRLVRSLRRPEDWREEGL